MGDKKRIVLIEDNEADVFLIEMAPAETRCPLEIRRFRDCVEALPVLLVAQDTNLPDLRPAHDAQRTPGQEKDGDCDPGRRQQAEGASLPHL